jgi:hypothetical protein
MARYRPCRCSPTCSISSRTGCVCRTSTSRSSSRPCCAMTGRLRCGRSRSAIGRSAPPLLHLHEPAKQAVDAGLVAGGLVQLREIAQVDFLVRPGGESLQFSFQIFFSKPSRVAQVFRFIPPEASITHRIYLCMYSIERILEGSTHLSWPGSSDCDVGDAPSSL